MKIIMSGKPQFIDKSSFPLFFLFSCTLFLSAALMFVLEPMFGKLLLPLVGGTPALWNTCMVFYQTLLFLGYLYAHWLSMLNTNQRQIQIHVALVIFSMFALPVALPKEAVPPMDSNPSWWLIQTLLLAIGLPFFVVCSTSPLLQKWFSRIGHRSSHDPYFLYAANNSGSLLALLNYPFLIEPHVGLVEQRLLWNIFFVLLCLLIIACAFSFWRIQRQNRTEDNNVEGFVPDCDRQPTISEQLHWLVFAFVPSSLLLGLTQFINTDIAPVPLLWIVPLTLYILSLVLVFSKWADRIHSAMLVMQPALLPVFIVYSFITPTLLPYWLNLILHAMSFFLAVMVCHGELAKRRPHAQYLTRFYLVMSFGGMLGGLFNTFAAPFIFSAVYEYPVMIVFALLLRPGLLDGKWYINIIFPLFVFILGLTIFLSTDQILSHFDIIGGVLILLAGLTYSFRRIPIGLGLLTAVILIFTMRLYGLASNVLFQGRNFFGVLSVRETVIADENRQPERIHELYHGTTEHGSERLTVANSMTPQTYYSRLGPVGQLFSEFDADNQNWNIGAVGLGAGALACYGKEKQIWRFYEIDPLVVEIAKNPRWFNYLSRCNNHVDIVIGDARLSLAKEVDHSFDLLILDAFSSDAIPTHLLTREAFELYFKKLKNDGLLAIHITNRHLALEKVLADHVNHFHFAALFQKFKPEIDVPLVVATDWVVMSKQHELLLRLLQNGAGQWRKLPSPSDLRPWTDDFTQVVGIWK
ncbi:MAG: fused MFS/spermidine synthase [Methylobacter sp.]